MSIDYNISGCRSEVENTMAMGWKTLAIVATLLCLVTMATSEENEAAHERVRRQGGMYNQEMFNEIPFRSCTITFVFVAGY